MPAAKPKPPSTSGHGGKRPGAGRKTDAERARLKAIAAVKAGTAYDSGEEDNEFWGRVYEDALKGKREAQRLWAAYRFGPPTVQKEEKDPNILLFCSFRGLPWHCVKCGEFYKPEEMKGKEDETQKGDGEGDGGDQEARPGPEAEDHGVRSPDHGVG